MRPIPTELKSRLALDTRMKSCALRGRWFGMCRGKVQWHHVWIYAGRQINEFWGILGACEHHHYLVDADPKVKQEFQRVSLELATEGDLEKYPRKDWAQIKRHLQQTMI